MHNYPFQIEVTYDKECKRYSITLTIEDDLGRPAAVKRIVSDYMAAKLVIDRVYDAWLTEVVAKN